MTMTRRPIWLYSTKEGSDWDNWVRSRVETPDPINVALLERDCMRSDLARVRLSAEGEPVTFSVVCSDWPQSSGDVASLINLMVGRTFTEVTGKEGEDELQFREGSSSIFLFYNDENDVTNDVSVRIEDIAGDLSDLVGYPIVEAEEVSSHPVTEMAPDKTWTFYRFSTVKGTVTVRWCGQSNGYYSEKVALRIVQKLGNDAG